MSKREQNPRPVRGWGHPMDHPDQLSRFVMYRGSRDHPKCFIEYHIAPTATHAVVELAKVEEVLRDALPDGESFCPEPEVDARLRTIWETLKALGIAPVKPKPSKPAKKGKK